MKTLNLILFVFLITIATSFNYNALAQSVYFDLSPGYALNLMPDAPNDVYMNSLTTYAPLKISGSFGKGWNYGANVGFFVTPYLAVELGFNQLSGGTYSSSQYLRLNDSQSITLDESNHGNMFRFCPMIKYSTFDGKILPFVNNTARDGGSWVEYYIKFGFIIGVSNSITSNQTITKTDTTTSLAYNATTVYSGGSSTGYNFRFGVSFKQNDNIFLFAEASFLSQYFIPQHSEITSYTYGGTDILNTLSASQRETNYITTYTSIHNTGKGPTQAAAKSYPFSSIGLNVGIQYKIKR